MELLPALTATFRPSPTWVRLWTVTTILRPKLKGGSVVRLSSTEPLANKN